MRRERAIASAFVLLLVLLQTLYAKASDNPSNGTNRTSVSDCATAAAWSARARAWPGKFAGKASRVLVAACTEAGPDPCGGRLRPNQAGQVGALRWPGRTM